MRTKKFLFLLAQFCLIPLTVIFGFTVGQGDFGRLATVYCLFFGAFIYIYHNVATLAKPFPLLLLAILLRLILVFAFPNLSDDYFRFVWDGRLLINGIHPLEHLPIHYILQGVNVPGLDLSLYEQLNSKEYFTVYPPFCQMVFAGACWLFPSSVYGSVVTMKLVFLCLEVGTLALLFSLLKSFGLPRKSILLYALNPLIILETFGNLHFEIAMVFFVLLALWLLVQGRWLSSAVAMGFGVAAKLLPLLFLPFLIRRLGVGVGVFLCGKEIGSRKGAKAVRKIGSSDWLRQSSQRFSLRKIWTASLGAEKEQSFSFWGVLRYFLVGGLVLVVLFVPLLGGFAENFGSSLNLYFQRFEFNASLYYLVRKIGYITHGYNLIQVLGPALILLAGVAILFLAFCEKSTTWPDLPRMWLLAMTFFLLATTTVHPWYLTGIIALSVLTRMRYPIVWSFLIMGTYMNYAGVEYQEQLWWVVLEYLVVGGVILWELRFLKNRGLS